jgi:uridine kinase
MDKVTIIIIAGGSASGKTTVAQTIANEILQDESVAHLSMDAYYKNLPHLTFEERRKVNYDHPSAIDIELLCQHIDQLKQGKSIEVPIYDFTNHMQSGKNRVNGTSQRCDSWWDFGIAHRRNSHSWWY